ncbi:PREDICTED: RAB6A-GEF complex partner protein 1-like isoform X2 [Amphimedon queenslandica]|uniref:Protein RIC1 homolog n=1 Tax=Amphimedon queenslandica TaxID=400682 RepID=A0AAN0IYZ0_AMPQE|nr:PREDICTED: RAB6A-GEF complex partner protein 1-like isoform X2 [Amphimedon queenslandica]|eukprot:XP_019849671.1 PREDICTED: RAB6A-GEF complex partner protein 1-like isoform X2 [Amphimedon queenslandica]
MYYPVGWPLVLDGRGGTGGAPLQLLTARNRTKNLIFELREHSIAVWHSRLHILLSSYKLSPGNIKRHGVNSCAVLKPDGSCLAISTSNGLLYFLHIIYNPNSSGGRYAYKEHGLSRNNPSFDLPSEGPPLEQVSLNLIHEVMVSGLTSVMCSFVGQLMVCSDLGIIHRVSWSGVFDANLSIYLSSLPFSNDLYPESRAQPLGELQSVVDISCSNELHGFAIVLSNGKTAFVTGKSAKFEPKSLQGVWLKETTDATCVAINPRYNLIVCGRANGLIDTYTLDDASGAWNKLNTLQLSKLHFADSDQYQLGAVQCLQWSPIDYSVLAVAWKNGGLSMWSVFGSLLFHSLGNQPGTPTPLFRSQSTLLQSLVWSIDTYQLWLLPRGEQLFDQYKAHLVHSTPAAEGGEDSTDTTSDNKVLIAGSHLVVINFVKSAFINNPVITNHQQLFLHSSDRLYLSPPLSPPPSNLRAGYYSNGSNELTKMEGVPLWKIIQVPPSYLLLNWPLQYAAISPKGDYVAVAGKAGLAVYLIQKRKWKLFGSELQEQSMVCRGGLCWFDDVIVFPCRVNGTDDEVRFFSVHRNLDTSTCLHILRLVSSPVRLNVLGPHLLIATRDLSLTLYNMSISYDTDKFPSLSIVKLHVMSFVSFVTRPWVLGLVSIVPSTIRAEPVAGGDDMNRLNSVLLNISGRVVMIQREKPTTDTESMDDEIQWSFSNPVSLAPSVEAIWTPPIDQTHMTSPNHMMESLWVACGAQGIKVWLPLYPRGETHPTFLSKRIMLTLPSSSSFPQTILFSEAIIVGVSHEPLHADHSLTTPLYFPPTNVRRITRLFLNHILRQLLKRNLGSHALQIARTHAHLSYFAHILELMLHEILEEEAPGSIPIPDALLPRVIEFIKEFPHFFETVGSCARKTEVALWNYLFAAVGNPKDLFEVCLVDSRLKTAASYLIIIQNLEPPAVSRHLATRLLDASLDNNQWELAKDLVRFLKRIGPGDLSPLSPVSSLPTPSTPYGAKPLKPSGPSSLGANALSSPVSNLPDLDQSVVMVTRDHLSSGNPSGVVSISGDYCDSSGKIIKRPHFALDVDTKEDFFIELILCRHARKLLTTASLSDLGLFAAHLEFDIPQWMAKERHRAACIDSYVQVLCDLHKQFHWPFPPSSTLTTPSSIATPSGLGSNTRYYPVVSDPKQIRVTPDREDNPDSSLESSSRLGLKRSNRPPDLNIPGTNGKVEVVAVNEEGKGEAEMEQQLIQEVIFQSSTPSKVSGGTGSSENFIKPTSSDKVCDSESIVETVDDDPSLWEEDVSLTTVWTTSTRTVQSEREIRYFVDASIQSYCIEWAAVLGILLQDSTVFIHMQQLLEDEERIEGVVFPSGIDSRIMTGVSSLSEWAASNCPGYLPFLSLITPILCQWQQSLVDHMKKTPGEAQLQAGTGVGSDPLDLLVNHESTGGSAGVEGGGEPTSPSETNKKILKQNNSNKTDTPSQETAHQQQKQDETGGCVIN